MKEWAREVMTTDRAKIKQELLIAHLGSLRYSFEYLREYLENVQSLFNMQQQRLFALMDLQTAGLSQNEKDQFYEWHSEDYWKLKDSFPDIHRNALFIAIYSEFEEMLKSICGALASKKGCDICLYTWRGGILEKAKSCFTKDIGIKWSISPELWDEVTSIRGIRNTIVHNAGWLDDARKDYEKLEMYISSERVSATLHQRDGLHKVQLTDSFISEVLGTLDQLLEELFNSVSEWVRQVKI